MVEFLRSGRGAHIFGASAIGLLSGGGGIEFLLRDDFTTDDAAPVDSPRTCEPGPGTLTFVQTDGQMSISSVKLNFPAQSTPVFGDQGFYGGVQTRATGLCLVATLNLTTWEECGLGWHTAGEVSDPDNFQHATQANGTDGRLDNNHAAQILTGLSTSTDYHITLVLRGIGAHYAYYDGTNWILLWVSASGNTASLYPVFANLDGAGNLPTIRVRQLPAPWTTDDGIATYTIDGSVSAGTTFTHESDCLIEWVQTTLPGMGTATRILFRQQDSTNAWYIGVSNLGNFSLNEYVADSPTQRAIAIGGVSAGHRVVIIATGNTIRGYSDNVLRWTYSSASNFLTETDGKRNDTIGTEAGTVTDLKVWPRTLSGATTTALDDTVA